MEDKGQEKTQIVDMVPIDGSLSDERCEQLIATIKDEPAFLERKEFGAPTTKGEKAKFKKAVLAMANTSGGYILLGVADDGTLKDIEANNLDNANLNNIASSSILPEIKTVRSRVYNSEGSRIGVIYVPPSDLLPHIPTKDAGEDIKKNAIYVRHSGKSEPANYDDIQRIIRKACLLKQKELLVHLGETELQTDVRQIKEFLLGKANRPESAETLLYRPLDEFIQHSQFLLDEGESTELLRVLRVGKRLAIQYWKKTKDSTKDKVLEVKDLHFTVLLNRMTYIALMAISDSPDDKVFEAWLLTMCSVYELSNRKDLGYNLQGEWECDASGRRLKLREHVSYTVPEKETVKRLLIVASWALHKRRYDLINRISAADVAIINNRTEATGYIVTQPNLSHSSGEGNLMSVFDEARELQVQDTVIASMFEDDGEQSMNDLLKADFLISFFLDQAGVYRFMNFCRFYPERVGSLLTMMREHPSKLGAGFPEFKADQLRAFLVKAVEFARSEYWAIGSSWNRYLLKDLYGDSESFV